MNRLVNSSLWGPSKAVNPNIYETARNTRVYCPVGNCFGNSINFYFSSIPVIAGLFVLRRPTTIRRFVIAVVIDPLHRVFKSWTRPNICREVFEGLPAMAYRYASSAVVLVCSTLRIFTSLLHSSPNTIEASVCRTVCREGPSGSCGCSFACKAAARFHIASSERMAAQNTFVPAVAATGPHPIALTIKSVWRRYEKATKALADQIGRSVVQFHGAHISTARYALGVIRWH